MTPVEEVEDRKLAVSRRFKEASTLWAKAMGQHKLAPPDAGFAARLRDLATAAAAEQATLQEGASVGLGWRPIPGAERVEPPYELRPGTGRRGPAPLWEQFDAAMRELLEAAATTDTPRVSAAFGAVSRIAGALADAVAEEDRVTESARARRAG
jgi:hypothetical protein